MKVPLLDLTAQYSALRDDIRAAMDRVCDAQAFILGSEVQAFERRVADYCGVSHAIGVSSGTDALLLALMALDVGPGDAVITTPYTFFATAGAVARLGATIVFSDIDPETYNLSPDLLKQCLERLAVEHPELKPRVLLPVHLFGQCADMVALLELAAEHDLKVVEDAAQAIGAQYPSARGIKKAGAMGDLGCFSFFPSKNLGAFGDAGMVVTDQDELAEKCRILRVHGASPKYYHAVVGGNFRLDALQAAVLGVKLERLDTWHAARQARAVRYDAAFAGSPIASPRSVYAGSGAANCHIYNQYVVRIPERDSAIESLRSHDIGTAIYYPVPLHLQECFSFLGYRAGAFPESERAAQETLALPVYPELTDEMQDYVIEVLRSLV
jgi:dTDP-4-amino-4,6-dideoxygalactose transaminase